nr:hypothetical protein [Tanacetum cinerariifolium]
MGDEHLNTIPATKSDEFIKSCVENLVPNPSESEGENGCDVLACFTTFSNVLFEADYESDSKSMLNRDSSIIPSSSKFDSLLNEFAGELTLLKSILPGIDKIDCYPEKEIHFTERLLYDNSSPRPPEEFVYENSDADIESFFPSLILVEDSDSFMEEIDLFLTPDDLVPPGIEEDDDDSKRDILILKELIDNYSHSLIENESFRFDIPSFSRPPAKPPDGVEHHYMVFHLVNGVRANCVEMICEMDFVRYLCCEDCGVLSEADHCQPPRYTMNHPIFNAHNDLLSFRTMLMEQMTTLTSMCEMVCQIVQKKQEEKKIEEEQAANAQYWKILACCNDDDDCNFAITPNEPVDSLRIGDEHLNTIPTTESNEFIKSNVENLVPNPSESEGENGCDVHACFTTFSNVLFDAEYEFDSSDDQSCSDEDFREKIFSNPLFEEEIIPIKIDQHHHNVESDLIESMLNHDSSIISSSSKIDSLLDEFVGELTLLKSISPGIDETDSYHENEIHLVERLLYDNSSPRPPEEFVSENSNADIKSFSPSPISIKDSDSFMEEIDLTFTPYDPIPPGIEEDEDDSERDILIHEEFLDNYSLSLPVIESYHLIFLRFLVLLQNHQMEKSPDLLSHRGFENFKLFAKRPMMIHEKNIPILDVPLFYFYPLDQLKYGGNWVKLSDLKQALRGRHLMLIRSLVFSNS